MTRYRWARGDEPLQSPLPPPRPDPPRTSSVILWMLFAITAACALLGWSRHDLLAQDMRAVARVTGGMWLFIWCVRWLILD